MTRSALCVVAIVASLGACNGDSEEPRQSGPTTSRPAASVPEPTARIPREAERLADRLTATQRALAATIDRWRDEGDLGVHPPPREVALWALHQQRIHLLLTARPALARQVLPRLPGRTAAHARATIRARRGLGEITPPTPGRYRTGPPEPPGRLLAHYREAQRRFDVPWPTLAAVNFVESAFGRMRNSSAAGAQGPMQFIASTWRAYGLGDDVNDPRDAIMGAANYLRASGAADDLRGALYAYNPSDLYVRAVLAYAGRIRRDRHAFLSYYSWQVFVREPGRGTRRITGPRPL
ncbi:MAG: transglycosylase SLT domain-containing protein [Thermoleophilaceae bacterium]